MNENLLTVVGNVVTTPVVKQTGAGMPFVAFRVASSSRRWNAQTRTFENGVTNFYNVAAFRSLAANLPSSLEKGHPVIVTGRLRVNQYVRKDNTYGTSVEIDAYAVGHDLTRGSATFQRGGETTQFEDGDRMGDPSVQAAHAELADEAYDVVDDVTGEVLSSSPGAGQVSAQRSDVYEAEDEADSPNELAYS